MPAIVASEFVGEVVFLGHVADRDVRLGSDPDTNIHAAFGGYAPEAHAGLTRPSDSRVQMLYPLDTVIRNTRQFSILSQEDLDKIAKIMGIAQLDPALAGASMVIKGIPDFTFLPPASRLQFSSGATLVTDVENRPCVLPGPEVDAVHPGFGKKFKPAATGHRGITAWVEREGGIALGDTVKLFIPAQRPWTYA